MGWRSSFFARKVLGLKAVRREYFCPEKAEDWRLELNHSSDVGWGLSVFAIPDDGPGVIAFGKTLARDITDQAVVVVGWCRQIEQALQEDMDRSCFEQIFAADHMGDALCRVIDDNREVVCSSHIAAGQNHVSDVHCKVGGVDRVAA